MCLFQILEGVTSWGSNRCDPKHKYTVFAKTRKFMQWIRKHIEWWSFVVSQSTLYTWTLSWFPPQTCVRKKEWKKLCQWYFAVVVVVYVVFACCYYCSYCLYAFLFFSFIPLSHNKGIGKWKGMFSAVLVFWSKQAANILAHFNYSVLD